MSKGSEASGRLWIGTSGWTYPHWRGLFYPPALKSSEYLRHYSRQFRTTELNYSFYHAPRPETYRKWAQQTPEDFLFAVKVHRSITHRERLRGADAAWKGFLESASVLGPKLGPFLFQFPPSFRCDRGLLADFLEDSRGLAHGSTLRLAFEFRHASWFDAGVETILRRFGAALVIAHSSRYPQAPSVATANFVYLRFHGPGALFSSSYSEEDLRVWAERIRQWLSERLDVYAYFNNDAAGCAIANAKTLKALVSAAGLE